MIYINSQFSVHITVSSLGVPDSILSSPKYSNGSIDFTFSYSNNFTARFIILLLINL